MLSQYVMVLFMFVQVLFRLQYMVASYLPYFLPFPCCMHVSSLYVCCTLHPFYVELIWHYVGKPSFCCHFPDENKKVNKGILLGYIWSLQLFLNCSTYVLPDLTPRQIIFYCHFCCLHNIQLHFRGHMSNQLTWLRRQLLVLWLVSCNFDFY